MSEHVRPDIFYPMTINGGEYQYMVNAKYDRIDYFPRFGAFILKIYDDEDGFVSFHLPEEDALKLQDHCELPIVPRDWMYESEHQGWVRYQAQNIEKLFAEDLGDIDLGEE